MQPPIELNIDPENLVNKSKESKNLPEDINGPITTNGTFRYNIPRNRQDQNSILNYNYSILFKKNNPTFIAYYINKKLIIYFGTKKIKITMNKNIKVVRIHDIQPIMAILCHDSSDIELYKIDYEKPRLIRYNDKKISDYTVWAVWGVGMDYKTFDFHPIEPIIVTVPQYSTKIKLWEFKFIVDYQIDYQIEIQSKTIIDIKESPNRNIAFHPNGSFMAICYEIIIIVFQIDQKKALNKNVKEFKKLKNTENTEIIWSINFSVFNYLIAGLENSAILWDFIKGNQILKIKTNSPINLILFNPNYNDILVISEDTCINFWKLNYSDLQDSKCKVTLKKDVINQRNTSKKIISFSFDQNSNLLYTTNVDGYIIWELDDEGIVKNYFPQSSQAIYNCSILIPSNFIQMSRKSEECENLKQLYDFIMKQDLCNGEFFIKYQNESGIDSGGLKREVFDKILKFYTFLYFQEIVSNNNYLILKKNIVMQDLINNTQQLILFAKASESRIYLRFDPKLIKLFLSSNPREFINNSKKNTFNDLYYFFETQISQVLEENNSSLPNYLIKNNTNSENFKTKISQKLITRNISKLEESIKKEILFRRFAMMCGFETWQEFNTMLLFILSFWNSSNEDIFTFEINFDRDSIMERIVIRKILSEPGQYPLDIQQLNLENIESEYEYYPYLESMLKYILGDESPNKNRIKFVKYLTGSQFSPSKLIIELSNIEISSLSNPPYYGQPFVPHTCFGSIELFKNPTTFKYNTKNINVLTINTEITKGLSSATYR